ncbi:auxin-responsive protein IAA6-like [Zingiber officinale]|uniref:auxin-responsive protein IAA6-like n=1 Tax=Zingiber officinale TaxID=94328 RepID=UPI001C4C95E2|nr:auxin-responsive protein IAA6-like [Zingiber officinale]XP_042409742.1 auxin-responsive protein IAA6-like [Zingiber officinale]XP_042409743.1 auxin-responsive protein IAA6-like [Zingiber officinale]
MEGEDFKNGGQGCPRLLDLIPNVRVVQEEGGGRRTFRRLDASEEMKLELRLGLPGGGLEEEEEEEESSVLSLGFISKASKTSSIRVFGAVKSKNEGFQHQKTGVFKLQSRAGTEKEHKTTWANGEFEQQQSLEKEKADGTAGPSTSSQTRAAAVPVVGWPPIRSFRKNLATNSAKQAVEPETRRMVEEVKVEGNKGLLVKINMDGIPIGRKVDLKAYDTYEKLSNAVEDLFLGLFEAQKDISANAIQKDEEAKKAFTGLMDGSGDYTLVYEDNHGHRMLVGDVPWEMFVSTVKRLRVLKNSHLSSLRLGSVCRKRTVIEC